MSVCTQCGAELDVGRFCVNCGHPVAAPATEPVDPDWRTGTAERAAIAFDPAPVAAPPGGNHAGPRTSASHPPLLPWLAGLVVLALVAVLGGWLLFSDGDGPDRAATTPTPSVTPEATPTDEDSTPPSSEPSEEPSDEPSDDPSEESETEPTDVARFARAEVPATAGPSQDLSGNAVRYEAANLLDGVATSCWRMPGDGTGEVIVLRLDELTTLTEVGLINGYAKTGQDSRGRRLDWYHGNRRVLAVTWIFDDGTEVQQELGDSRKLQTISVEDVATEVIRLRLDEVSAPGSGRAARNYTPISDVSLVGTPD